MLKGAKKLYDPRLSKLAHLLVNYSLGVKKGDQLAVIGSVNAQPLMLEVYKEALVIGALPDLLPSFSETSELYFKYASDEQLQAPPSPIEMASRTSYDALLTIQAPSNVKSLSQVGPAKITLSRRAGTELSKIFWQRMSSGEMRWCGTLYPTQGLAQEAGMGYYEYADFVFKAGLLDADNPEAEWLKIHDQQERVSAEMDQRKSFRIVSEDTDLRFQAAGRHWVNCDGKLNFPDGEVFTGPIEDTVEGHIRFSFPGIYGGKEIEDIRLTFERGKVVKAEAAKGQELLHALLDTDAGSRYVGEIAVGTNPGITKFSKNMLFDEKIGGTVHLALGRSIPMSFGKNESAIHWDMLCDMRQGGEIFADGELIYKAGKFLFA
jgi:aminopeptidase